MTGDLPSSDFVVVHPARTVPSPSVVAAEFLAAHPEVQIIQVRWVDICGITRERLLNSSRFLELVQKHGAVFTSGPLIMAQTVSGTFLPVLLEHFTVICELRLDVPTLRPERDTAGIGNKATVVGESSWLGLDARLNLKRVLAEAERNQGLKFIVGFEIEVCYLKPHTLEPAAPKNRDDLDLAPYTWKAEMWPVLNETLVALAEAGIVPLQCHKEYGPSQWEFPLPPAGPVEAVDMLVSAREIIKAVAYKHGVTATTFPAPGSKSAPNGGQKSGLHMHISATTVKEDQPWDTDMAMGGILSHVPELMAIGMSQIDSYGRVGENMMMAGGYLGWGENNRAMPVRRVEANHWEIRIVDGTTNPYAMAAGVVAAVTDPKPLTLGNSTKWTPWYSDEEKISLGLTQKLPATLAEALDTMEQKREWMDATFGSDYIKWFLLLKRSELEVLGPMDEDERKLRMVQQF